MKIKPLNTIVLLIPEQVDEKTATGFILPEIKNKDILIGKISALGKNCDEDLKVGQRVAYAKFSGSEVAGFLMINETDILGILEEEICQHDFYMTVNMIEVCRKCGFERGNSGS